MMQSLNPYLSKTDEIMSRYRPIAPKPTENHGGSSGGVGGAGGGPMIPEKLRHSPYFRSIWSHLQARPTRTRRRGRSGGVPSPTTFLSRQQHEQQFNLGQPGYIELAQPGGYSSPNMLNCQHGSLAMHAADCMVSEGNCLVTLPLLTCEGVGEIRKCIDYSSAADAGEDDEGLLDLQLSSPSFSSLSSSPSPFSTRGVISPRPIRPVGSKITVVGPISENLTAPPPELAKPDELEAAGEAVDALPMVILDRKNKVRVANSAYKELVGQPECPWLGSMMSSSNSRLNGEILVQLPDPTQIPCSGNGFWCWVSIEWESDGKKKWVNAFSEGVKLACESKDYHFSWRFHTTDISPSSS